MATEYRQRPGMGDHFDDEDLVMSSAQQRRNWRGILIALMVIVAVLAMIVTSVVLLTPPQPEELSDSYSDLENGNRAGSDYYYNQRANDELWWRRRGMRTLRLSDIMSDSAGIKLFNGTWISGNELFYVTGSGDLAIMEIMVDGTIQTTRHLMSKETLQSLKGSLISFELSPDRDHVLIGHDAKKLFRYSKTARYTVYTVSTGQMTPLTLDDHRRRNGTSAGQQPCFLHAQWHKISTTTDKNVDSMALIAVYRYDVFYVPWTMRKASAAAVADASGDGRANVTEGVSGTSNVTKSPASVNDAKADVNGSSTRPESSKTPWPHGPVRRITTSGSGSTFAVGLVSNGVADYLYEMEILKRSPAVWPSSGRYLIYATFDDRRVGEYKYSVYMKDGRQRETDDEKHSRKQKLLRKKKRRRRRIRRNAKPDAASDPKDDGTSEYYLYPEIRTLRYPKANTPNPIVTLSVIVNLDQLGNPEVQPKIRKLTPPPIFQYTDDFYFTAVQWVNDGGINRESDDDQTAGASAAEVCVIWLNRAQNTSVTTLCKSPMWLCLETQEINAVGANGGNGLDDGGQANDALAVDRARRRYRRNGVGGPRKSPSDAAGEDSVDNKNFNNHHKNNASYSHREQHQKERRQQQHQRQHRNAAGQRQRNGHHSRARRAGDGVGGGTSHDGTIRGRYGGWVDATVGGAGGGVPSTGGGVSDNVLPSASAASWWSDEADGGDNFAGDDGYAGIAGAGDYATGAGYTVAMLVRRGWEAGDKELTPRAPVFAADGQGYVSVAPVRDEGYDDDDNDAGLNSESGRVRLRRPSPKPNSSQARGRWSTGQSSASKYYAQVVTVNITKKLLTPLTFGELDDDDGGSSGDNRDNFDKKYRNVVTKSWTVVRVLAWDQRTDMIYFLAVPSGRGAPHHRHLYAIKFTSSSSSSTPSSSASNRAGYNHQPQYHKTVRHSTRSRPVCLSCDVGTVGSVRRRERREFGGKQNRMDEARDDRLRQQQRERWRHQQEEKKDNEEEAATAEEEERRKQRNRRRQEMLKRGASRHCTYYDAQFSRDGSHYALICLGPSVPYVTIHKVVTDHNNYDHSYGDSSGVGDDVVDDGMPHNTQDRSKNPSYSFEFIALVENNTRLQDKYTNRVLLPGTRTFQLRLSGGRKLTTSGGLHFHDPLAAADYYSNGGGQQLQFSAKMRPDSDPLTAAQVRLYLPPGVYDPEADPRPEFMTNHVGNNDGSIDIVGDTNSKNTGGTSDSTSSTNGNHRRRRSSSSSSPHESKDGGGEVPKRQRRKHKQQRQHRIKKLYPMLVVVNSDPGSQAITDRFTDRLGYTTGLLCSGSLDRIMSSASGTTSARYGGNKWDRRSQKGRRDRRSSNRYYSSGYLDDDDDSSYKYDQYNEDDTNNQYVVAVVDTGRGTWARGYESLLALSYGSGNDGNDYGVGDDNGSEGLLGTADLRDQMEAIEYLLSSATTNGDSFKDDGQGYYSENRPRRGHGNRDRSRWFSSSSQSNRRYYSDDDDDYYDDDEEYYDKNDKNSNEDYYYYYYSNGDDNSDYDGRQRNDDYDNDKRSRRDRRSTSDAKENSEALRLPYVDATRVALLGGGPTSPSTPPSVYGGYAAARMALWQSIHGGAPIERRSSETNDNGNRKEPVAIHSSFKCAVTMAPVFSWRLYASAFAERYYGYYGVDNEDTWVSYDRSDLIPFTILLNESSISPSSHGKGINLLVVHGTADTTIHPQHSMMLVRGVMQQQQQQYFPAGLGSNLARRYSNSTTSGRRVAGGFPNRVGTIRLSQFVMPDVDLSNSRMATGIENDYPENHDRQLLHSIYSHVTQYLANECFIGVGEGSRGRGVRIRGQRLRKRRRRWRTGDRDQEKPDDQKNQRSVNNGDRTNSNAGNNYDGGDRNTGGRYRRQDIDSSQTSATLESKVKDGLIVVKIKTDDNDFRNNNTMKDLGGHHHISSNFDVLNSNKSSSRNRNKGKKKKKNDDSKSDDDDDDSDDDENIDKEYSDEDDERDGSDEKNDDYE